MREILFRARHSDPYDGEGWYYGYYERNDHKYHYINEENSSIISIDPKTLGQFMGIYDKNGVKIFEGDVVIAPFLVPKMTLKLVANMEWDNIWWSFADKLNNYCEIIGNIYDNPELLEVNNA